MWRTGFLLLLLIIAALAGGQTRAAGAGTDPGVVVAAYTAAIAAHDAKGVCASLSTGIQEDIAREARSVDSSWGCPELVRWGWAADEGLAAYTTVDVRSVGTPVAEDGLDSMTLDAHVTFDDGSGGDVSDVVWLQQEDGAWAIAKPSELLAAVSHWGSWWSRYGEPTAEPDLDAYARRRDAERKQEAAQKAADAAAWTPVAAQPAPCAERSSAEGRNAAATKHELWSNGDGAIAADEVPHIDLARGRLTRAGSKLCLDVWTRKPLPSTASITLRASPSAAAKPRGASLLVTLDGQRGTLRNVTGMYPLAGPYLTARLGRFGTRLQVVIALSRAPAVFRRTHFVWSLVSETTRPGSDLTYGDELPRPVGVLDFPRRAAARG